MTIPRIAASPYALALLVSTPLVMRKVAVVVKAQLYAVRRAKSDFVSPVVSDLDNAIYRGVIFGEFSISWLITNPILHQFCSNSWSTG